MNCRHIEELIPLYVEGDLDADNSGAVLSHAQICASCSELIAEYEESQRWLHSYTPPHFDDASLDDLKLDVLRGIHAQRMRPSFLQRLSEHWTRRQAFATSAALLIIFAAIGFYVYQRKANEAPVHSSLAAGRDAEQKEQSPEVAPRLEDRKQAPRAFFVGKQRPGRASAARSGTVARVFKSREPLVERPDAGSVELARARATANSAHDEPATSDEMLRIEIQTSDPSIRIIWFLPKESDAHQTKNTTETE